MALFGVSVGCGDQQIRPILEDKIILLIGDSTASDVTSGGFVANGIDFFFDTPLNGCSIVNLAVPGETTSQQLTRLNTWLSTHNGNDVYLVYDAVGINDAALGHSLSTIRTNKSSLHSAIHAECPNAHIVQRLLTPAHRRFLELPDGANRQIVWEQYNADLMVNYYSIYKVITEPILAIGGTENGLDNCLLEQYRLNPDADFIHQNDDAKAIEVPEIQAIAINLGFRFAQ